jgi:hypothetical protein
MQEKVIIQRQLINTLKMWKKFKDFGKTVMNQNYIHEDIKSRLNSGNAYYHSCDTNDAEICLF